MQTLVVLLALIACACAQHGPPHRLPKRSSVPPADTAQRTNKSCASESACNQQRHKQPVEHYPSEKRQAKKASSKNLIDTLIEILRKNYAEDLPPGFADILPPDVVAKMRAVHRDESLTGEQQMEKIHEIMNTVPDSIREKLPKPPGFDRLPAATRAELDKIHRDKTLTFRQRHEKIKKIFDALPPHLRPHPPPPPPPTL